MAMLTEIATLEEKYVLILFLFLNFLFVSDLLN